MEYKKQSGTINFAENFQSKLSGREGPVSEGCEQLQIDHIQSRLRSARYFGELAEPRKEDSLSSEDGKI